MRIILVAGMPGAGKEEFLTVARGMGLPFLRMGDLVREAYASSDCESRGISVGQFANSERETHGKDVWAKRALDRMDGEVFLVDGCRSMDEVESYRSLGEEIIILGIHTPPRLRYERLVARGRDDAPRDIREFEARDAREMGWGLSDVIALSDVMITNESDLDTFRSRSTEALETML